MSSLQWPGDEFEQVESYPAREHRSIDNATWSPSAFTLKSKGKSLETSLLTVILKNEYGGELMSRVN